MSRIVSMRELAATFTGDVRDVERWIEGGCPHFRLRPELVLLDYVEVSRWLLSQPPRDVHPLALLGAKVFTARTLQDVDRLHVEIAALVARGQVDIAQVPAIRRGLDALERKLLDEGEDT